MKNAAFIALAAVGAGGAADAQTAKQSPPAFATVIACRAEHDSEARLRCFDAAAASLDQALRAGTVVAMDKEAVRQTRKGLFGFNIPKLPFLGGDEDQVDEVRSRVRAARESGFQRWEVDLEDDGGTWMTIDTQANQPPPRAGAAVTIKRGVLSYMMRVGGRGGIRVRRVR